MDDEGRRVERLSRLAVVLAPLACLVFAPTAGADLKIRQIHPSLGMLGGDWVELQVSGGGDNTVNGKAIRTFGPSGEQNNTTYVIPGTPTPNTADQRLVLVSSLFTPMGVSSDFTPTPAELDMTGQDGAVCLTQNNGPAYTPIDCVSYGSFTGSIPSAGMPAVQTPFETTLERKISAGCATLLDSADDTNNSSADFAASTNPPRNNATTPTETPCGTPPTGGGSGTTGTTGSTPTKQCKKKKKKRSAEVAKKKKCKKKKR
jgi:hypothetical protein